jgi:hypothetical protein
MMKRKKAVVRLQCGYEGEDQCKLKNCLECNRMLQFNSSNISLAEATCIEDFADVDLDQWRKERPEQITLAQNIMRKLNKRVGWGKA